MFDSELKIRNTYIYKMKYAFNNELFFTLFNPCLMLKAHINIMLGKLAYVYILIGL